MRARETSEARHFLAQVGVGIELRKDAAMQRSLSFVMGWLWLGCAGAARYRASGRHVTYPSGRSVFYSGSAVMALHEPSAGPRSPHSASSRRRRSMNRGRDAEAQVCGVVVLARPLCM